MHNLFLVNMEKDDLILTVPSNIERYRTNDNTVRERIHRLNRVIACCDQFLVFQIWKGNNEVWTYLTRSLSLISSRLILGGNLCL